MKDAADSNLVFGGTSDYKRKLMSDRDSASKDRGNYDDGAHYKASK